MKNLIKRAHFALYILLTAGFIWFAVAQYVNHKREVKHKIEMHKLNIEKVKLEIQILEQKSGDSLAVNYLVTP